MENTEAKQEERVKSVQSRSNLRSRESLKCPARYESNVATLSIPLTFKEAMKSEEASQWIETINRVRSASRERDLVIVERKPGMKIIDSKWVFKLIRDNNGNIYRFKAQLCVRRFMQQQGVDFTEMFVPVKYESLRMLLTVIAAKDLELRHANSVPTWRAEGRNLYGCSRGSRSRKTK